MAINWRRNLLISWIGCFFTGASFSLVMPFLPVYIEQLGTPKSQVELFSGLAISVTAFAAAIVSPIWGNLADRKGRRLMMIRAAAGMTLTMGSLAFVPNVYWLLIMRFMTGVLSGYAPNATAMIASQSKKRLGIGNTCDRRSCWKFNWSFDWRNVSAMVRITECLHYYRSYFADLYLLDGFYGERKFPTDRKGRCHQHGGIAQTN